MNGAVLPEVDVAIATFRRAGQLARTLDSIAVQSPRPRRVIVVDNDAAASARAVVHDFAARSGIETVYAIEPEQNIAGARNRGVSLAAAEFLAVLDDDETAASGWLEALLRTAVAERADAVFGAVEPVLPPGVPAWVERGAFFARPRPATGTRLRWGSSANALYRRAVLQSLDGPFDLRFGLTGGEDLDLGRRLHRAGCVLVACDEATVRETVPVERARLRWLTRRAFRGGQSHADVYRTERRTLSLAWVAGSRAFGAAVVAPLALLLACADRPRGIRLWLRAAGWFGQAAALLPWRYQEYRVPH